MIKKEKCNLNIKIKTLVKYFKGAKASRGNI